jgi:type III secretion system chaperone SycN
MDWIQAAIAEFGQSMGMPELELDEQGQLVLDLEDGSELLLQDLQAQGGHDFIVSLACPCSGDTASALRQALRSADHRRSPQWPVQVALHEQDLLITIRIARNALMSSSLEEAIDGATALQREARHGT